jgi:hypothetical protein
MAKSTQTSAELKRAFAQAIMAEAAKKGINNPVIVLPTYDEASGELNEDECVTPSKKNPMMGYVGFYQLGALATQNKRLDLEIEHWAISIGRTEKFEAKYSAGQILPGRIAIEETFDAPNPEDTAQDLKFLSAACKEAGVPCTKDGKDIYQIKWYDPTGTAPDVLIAHDNQEEINEVNLEAKAQANKANSNALRGASPARPRRVK